MSERLSELLAEAARAHNPEDARAAILGRLRRRRRRRRLARAGLVLAVAAAAGVPIGLVAQARTPSPARVSTVGRGKTTPRPPAYPSTTVGSSHAQASMEQAAAALAAFVAQEDARYQQAYASAHLGEPVPGGKSVHSSPVVDGGQLVALVAFSHPGDSHPVQVLVYRKGSWSVAASLPPPGWPAAAKANGIPLTSLPVEVANATGHPDFLVLLSAADNTPGFVVTKLSGTWGYVTFNGPYPPSDVVGRNPSFVDGRLVTQYDDCSPSCAAGHTYDLTWTFRPARGDFWAPDPPGWTPVKGAENYQATSQTTGSSGTG